MIHIFPTQKVHIDPHAKREPLVVCTTDLAGNLHVLGLEKYLCRGRRRKTQIGQRAAAHCTKTSSNADTDRDT
jgi:hypothetical protein